MCWEDSMSRTIASNSKMVIRDYEKLSGKAKREVADFVAFLKVKEELEATKETLSDKDFLQGIIKGDEDFKSGRFKKWSEVKEDV